MTGPLPGTMVAEPCREHIRTGDWILTLVLRVFQGAKSGLSSGPVRICLQIHFGSALVCFPQNSLSSACSEGPGWAEALSNRLELKVDALQESIYAAFSEYTALSVPVEL